jgi:hypothetical protein
MMSYNNSLAIGRVIGYVLYLVMLSWWNLWVAPPLGTPNETRVFLKY